MIAAKRSDPVKLTAFSPHTVSQLQAQSSLREWSSARNFTTSDIRRRGRQNPKPVIHGALAASRVQPSIQIGSSPMELARVDGVR